MTAPRHRDSRIAVALCACLTLAAGARADDRPAVRIPRVDHPPVLADYLDGRVEPPGVKVTGFVQREPGDGVPSSLETTAYLSYDAEHLYAVFVCKDDPARVRANLTRREAISGDDTVGVIVDTYNDGRRAYLFLTNPLGIQMDGVSTEGQDDDYSFDTLWWSDGRLTGDGYMVSIAIPFRSLRFRSEDVQTWRVALARTIPRNNESVFWPYITRRIASVGQQMATLEGIAGASPGRNLQAIPYGSFNTARFLDEDGRRVEDSTGRIGVDGKAVIKDTVTVDLTVNPDFSQIESDEPQVTINQRFEVFFPEKRPFFIENASYFETPQNIFFSRRIADPELGVRVTGKSRGWAFGALVAGDEEPGQEVPPESELFGKRAGDAVIRVQREFRRQSYVGGIFTDRELGETANRVFGVDGRWRFDDNWSATGQWIGSTTSDGRDKVNGSSVLAGIQREGRAFDYEGQYLSRSPEFRTDLGFIPRVDMQEVTNEASYRWFPSKPGRVLSVRGELETEVLWDYGGELQEWTVEPAIEVELPGQTILGLRQWTQFERFAGLDFRPDQAAVYADSAWLDWLSSELFYRWGTGINYYPPEGIAPFLANAQEVQASVTFRPTSRLRLDETYLFSRLQVGDESSPTSSLVGADIFNNHIIRSRVNYQFTPRLSTRLIIDYEAVLPNETLVSLEREKRLAFDVLATYMVNPWTAVYVGYTDAYANLLLEDPLEGPVTRGGAPTTSVGRQLFVKVSYLLKY